MQARRSNNRGQRVEFQNMGIGGADFNGLDAGRTQEGVVLNGDVNRSRYYDSEDAFSPIPDDDEGPNREELSPKFRGSPGGRRRRMKYPGNSDSDDESDDGRKKDSLMKLRRNGEANKNGGNDDDDAGSGEGTDHSMIELNGEGNQGVGQRRSYYSTRRSNEDSLSFLRRGLTERPSLNEVRQKLSEWDGLTFLVLTLFLLGFIIIGWNFNTNDKSNIENVVFKYIAENIILISLVAYIILSWVLILQKTSFIFSLLGFIGFFLFPFITGTLTLVYIIFLGTSGDPVFLFFIGTVLGSYILSLLYLAFLNRMIAICGQDSGYLRFLALLVVSLGTLAALLVVTLKEGNVNQGLHQAVVYITIVPFLAVVILLWEIFVVRQYFRPLHELKEMIAEERAREKEEIRQQAQEDDDANNDPQLTYRTTQGDQEPTHFQENLHKYVAWSLLGMIIFVELVLVYQLTLLFSDGTTNGYMDYILIYIYMFAVPFLAYFCIKLAQNKHTLQETFVRYPLLFGILPTFGTVPAYASLRGTDYEYIGRSILVLPILGTLAFIGLSVTYRKDPIRYYTLMLLAFSFFIFPVGFLLSFGYYEDSNNVPVYFIAYILIGIGLTAVVLIGLYWLIQLVVKHRKKFTTLYKRNKYPDNIQVIVLFMILLSAFTLIYTFYMSDTTDIKAGRVLGLVFALSFFYILSNKVIRVKLEKTLNDASFGVQQLGEEPEDVDESEEIRDKKRQNSAFQRKLFLFGFILPMLVGIPLGIVFSLMWPFGQNVVVVIMIGVVFSSLMAMLLIEVKKFLVNMASTYADLSLLILGIWFFIVLPFFVFIPCALAYTDEDDRESFKQIMGVGIGLACLFCMCGVSITSISINQLLKRMEYEKKAKKIVTIVKKRIWKLYRVRANPKRVRTLFDRFEVIGPGLVQLLRSKTAFRWWADGRPEKDLVTVKEYEQMEAKQAQQDRKIDLAELKKEQRRDQLRKKRADRQRRREEQRQFFDRCMRRFTDEKTPQQIEEEENLKRARLEAEAKLRQEYEAQIRELGEFRDPDLKVDDVPDPSELESNPIDYVKGVFMTDDLTTKSQDLLSKIMSHPFYNILKRNKSERSKWLQGVLEAFRSDPNTMTEQDALKFIEEVGLREKLPPAKIHEIYTQVCQDQTGVVPMKEGLFEVFLEQSARELYWDDDEHSIDQKVTKFIVEYLYPIVTAKKPTLNYDKQLAELVSDSSKDAGSVRGDFELYQEYGISDDMVAGAEKMSKNFLTYDNTLEKLKYQRKIARAEHKRKLKELNRGLENVGETDTSRLGRIKSSIKKFLRRIGLTVMKCLKSCLTAFDTDDRKFMEELEKEEKKQEEEEEKQGGKKRNRRRNVDWDTFSEKFVDIMEVAKQEAEKTDDEDINFSWNFSNIIIIVGKILEFYAFMSVAFRPGVGWNLSESGESAALIPWMETPESMYDFPSVYWANFGLAILYILLAVPAAKYARSGRLGMQANGEKAKFFSKQFFLSKTVTILGSNFYMSIIKKMLDTLACDYETMTLYQDPSLECFSRIHYLYLGTGLLALLFYYPLATFMYPNLQFNDKTSDIKFSPGYMVFLSQAKLVLVGVTVFFPTESDVYIMLFTSSTVLVVISAVSLRQKPCLLQLFNLWNAGGFVICLWVVTGAIVFKFTNERSTCLALIFAGLIVGLLILIILHTIKLREKRKTKQQDIDANSEISSSKGGTSDFSSARVLGVASRSKKGSDAKEAVPRVQSKYSTKVRASANGSLQYIEEEDEDEVMSATQGTKLHDMEGIGEADEVNQSKLEIQLDEPRDPRFIRPKPMLLPIRLSHPLNKKAEEKKGGSEQNSPKVRKIPTDVSEMEMAAADDDNGDLDDMESSDEADEEVTVVKRPKRKSILKS